MFAFGLGIAECSVFVCVCVCARSCDIRHASSTYSSEGVLPEILPAWLSGPLSILLHISFRFLCHTFILHTLYHCVRMAFSRKLVPGTNRREYKLFDSKQGKGQNYHIRNSILFQRTPIVEPASGNKDKNYAPTILRSMKNINSFHRSARKLGDSQNKRIHLFHLHPNFNYSVPVLCQCIKKHTIKLHSTPSTSE